MAQDTDIKDEEKPAAKPPEKPSKLVPAILVANTVLMGAVLGVVLLRKPEAGSPAPPTALKAAPSAERGKAAEGKEGSHGKGGGSESGESTGQGESAAADPAGAPGPMLKLENFIIQLRGTDTDRYVRVAFDLELTSEADRAPLQAHMPHIRDAIITYFSDRSIDELRGSEGMERVKAAVAKRLDDLLGSMRVRAVFITELVIQ
ncbi:MAG: flagellar basal body-associated FliL family protein [Polyangia bacterium]|jgi:flagellar FliL protein